MVYMMPPDLRDEHISFYSIYYIHDIALVDLRN